MGHKKTMAAKRKRRRKKLNTKRKKAMNSQTQLEQKKEVSHLVDVHFVMQEKGGTGKTTYTTNTGNYTYMNNIPVRYADMETGSQSTFNALKFVDARKVDLIDPVNKVIDRNRLQDFLTYVVDPNTKFKTFFCDLGAAMSEQMLQFLITEETNMIFKMFVEMGVKFHFHIVLDADNEYSRCSTFCENIFKASMPFTQNYIVKNMRGDFSHDQEKDIAKMNSKQKKDIE